MENVMKKRAVAGICALAMIFGLTMMSTGPDLEASDDGPMLDGSRLTCGTESTGTDTKITRGENLQIGYSKLRVLEPGVIYAGGTTIAEHTCESVQVTVIVERAKWDDEEWEFVDTWDKENTNADLASTSRRLEVDGDWYYRVRCIHSADGDVSNSSTEGLYVGVPDDVTSPEEESQAL